MLRHFSLFLLFFSAFFPLLATADSHKIKHVIYITFDGTRWQDIFVNRTYLKVFWEKYANKVNMYGMPNSKSHMFVASIPISLPSYQSQMAGTIQSCLNNQCGRITVQTLPESLKEKMSLRKQDVAVFSSWYEILFSAEHIYGSIFTNTGNFPVYDPVTQTADNVMYNLNMQQTNDTPGENVRYDKYTFAQAMHYFEIYKPRFLWISLNNADEAAHENNINKYQDALYFYDYVIDTVFTQLKSMKVEDETMVIVTTDHGRGNGILWTSHGPGIPASKQTWAFVMNGHLKPIAKVGENFYYSTLSIRPTIESALIDI